MKWPTPRLSQYATMLALYGVFSGVWLALLLWHYEADRVEALQAWHAVGLHETAILAQILTAPAIEENWELVGNIASQATLGGEGLEIAVINRNGIVMADSPTLTTEQALFQAVALRTFQPDKIEDFAGASPYQFFYAVPLGSQASATDNVLVTRLGWATEYQRIEQTQTANVMGTLMTFGVGWGLWAAFTYLVTHPVRVLSRLAQAVSEGHAEQRAVLTSPIREIQTLSRAFNQMLDTLQAQQAALQQHTAELEALHATALALTQQSKAEHVNGLLADVVTQAVALSNSASGSLFLCDAERRETTCVIDQRADQVFLGAVIPYGRGITGQVAETGEAVIVNDYMAWPTRLAPSTMPTLLGSVLSVPLRWQTTVIGVLNLHHPTPGFFAPHQLKVQTLLASYAALAINNARQFQAERRQLAALTILHDMALELNQELDRAQLLSLLVERARALSEAESVSFYRQTSAPAVLELAASAPATALGARWELSDEDVVGQVTRTGNPYVGRAPTPWPPTLLPHLHPDTQAAVLLPVQWQTQLWGVLLLEHPQPEHFDAPMLEVVGLFVKQAGVALTNARLFAAAHRRETAFRGLHQLGLDLSRQLDLPSVLHLLVEQAMRLVKAGHGGLYLTLPDSPTLELVAVQGHPPSYVGTRLPWGEGVAGRVAQTGHPMLLGDYQNWPHRTPAFGAATFQSLMQVPIQWQGQVLGVLSASDDQRDYFTPADIEVLNLFAHQAAVAIVNARLYEAGQTHAREASAAAAESANLYQLSAQLLSPAPDVRALADHITRIIAPLYPALHCAVLLLDDSQTRFFIAAQSGPYRISDLILRLDGAGIIPQAAREGRVMFAPDVTVEPNYVAGHPHTQAELVVPLRVADPRLPLGGRIIGVLNFEAAERAAFDDRTQRILTAFAEHAALALENARLLTRLHLAREIAEEANQLKSQFLANTSHELRTPLTGIIGALSIVLDGLYDSPAEQREFVQVAYDSSRNLLRIVNDVLDIAKIEAGHIDVDFQVFNLNEVVEEVQALVWMQAEAKQLALVFNLPLGEVWVYADTDKVRQILLNLIANAIKFTETGRVTLTVEAEPATGFVLISVVDTGIGIAPEVQPRLFQPFVQADGTTTRRYGGTGLGLSISRQLTELMYGSLELESAGLGHGTTLRLRLPTAEASAPAEVV